ncbi:hypothetical protein M407DRAFT_11976 [Tulasnella calospora MUT 4182]|uniref:Uncharacterized protein n=1 Tax=Tulasnella calospora MUT 4182 TaxID=1051891 RepID=A0A0C3PTX9_9AGAM|nr:hypothetical protein M407DRAFT_11976 [Tulasnella calospora MUT 4182]
MIRASFVYLEISTFRLFKIIEEGRDFYNHLADYCSALERQDWGLLSLVFWTISRLQRNQMSGRFLGSGLESLRTAYMGDVNITLLHLNSALTVVLDPRSEELLKRYGIVTIVLQCVNNLMAAGRNSGSIGLEDQFKVLGGYEAALRAVAPQGESRGIIRKIRIEVQEAVKDLLPAPDKPWSLQTNRPLHDEDLDILHTFSPLMRDLWVCSPYCWATRSGAEWSSVTGELRAQRDAARDSFNTFVLKVDKSQTRPIRDPEMSWCQLKHEPSPICIAPTYLLPTSLPTACFLFVRQTIGASGSGDRIGN